MGSDCMAVATWIDNIFTFANSATNALAMAYDCENHLVSKWGLRIKASSRAILVCKGGDISNIGPEWKLDKILEVLGHRISYDAGIRTEWRHWRPILWKIFWSNAAHRSTNRLPFDLRALLLSRTVLSAITWLFGRWPLQKSVSAELDQLQSRFLGILSKCRRDAHESLESWFKKRQRVGRALAGKIGFWSDVWRKRVLDWEAHICRSDGRNHVHCKMRKWHDLDWLQDKRLQFVAANGVSWGRNTPLAGRLGTRKASGQPQPRWGEGVALAHELSTVRTQSAPHNSSGSSFLSVGSRIREARSFLSRLLNP